MVNDELVFVRIADDWEGVYFNNKLIKEGHDVGPHELIAGLIDLKVDLSTTEVLELLHDVDGEPVDWLDLERANISRCPDTLTEYRKIASAQDTNTRLLPYFKQDGIKETNAHE